MKVEFCQFKLWMLYRTSVVLSGKLFRTKRCLWLNPISVNLLCKSKSSHLVYSLQPFKVLPSSAYYLGRPYKRWAMLPLIPQWSHHTWVRITWIFSTRVYTLTCTRSCSACRVLSFTCFAIFELIEFMYFGSTLIYPHKEFLIPRPPRPRSKFNLRPPPRSKFKLHPLRTQSSAGFRTRLANVGTRNPHGLTHLCRTLILAQDCTSNFFTPCDVHFERPTLRNQTRLLD